MTDWGATILDGTPAQSKDFVVFLWQLLILPKADAGIKCYATSSLPLQIPMTRREKIDTPTELLIYFNV